MSDPAKGQTKSGAIAEPSDRDESEQFYRFLVDGLLDVAIYWLSPSGNIQSWNKGAERITGYSASEVIGKHFSMFYMKDDRDRKFPDYELQEADRVGRYESNGWRMRKDGGKFWADVIIASLHDEDGKPRGFAKVVRDASERKKAEELIERQKRDLIELSTPVIHLWHGILALPIVGTLDSARCQIVMEKLLEGLVSTGCGVAILDISGVPTVDTLVAQHLMKTISAARLMGAECIISGIRPETAQTIVHLGVDLSTVKTKSSMARALEEALSSLNMKVVTDGHRN